MTTPGSSGKAGPTPISVVSDGTHDGEQVRPSFHFRGWYLSYGDVITGFHRLRKINVVGTLIVLCGCLCVSTDQGIFPLQRIAIHAVDRPKIPLL